eukprot:TRINITY_DN13359_c0_g1_i2.p1 TRINITY_DN13359_c0_g1~~TRINITY_DN13359_c0_g1_i2.p1  ORF type:complete len:177 (+),score=52.63 TRINITY_DN13359_c0_g1_i2:75-605(+)
MLIPKKNRNLVYSYLFKEGVLVAKKDTTLPKHGDIDVPNIHVMMLLRSLKSKGYVKENFNWGWFYWFLTNEGIDYLRTYLGLPEEIVPDTLKKPRTAPTSRGPAAPGRFERGDRPPRRGPADDKKLGAPSGDFKPEFRGGGLGRGGAPRGDRQQGGRDNYRREGGAPGGFGRGTSS